MCDGIFGIGSVYGTAQWADDERIENLQKGQAGKNHEQKTFFI